MIVQYIRVSTIEQNEARQIEALEKYGIDKWYIEKVSAKDTNRAKLNEMLDFVREGDYIYILDFSRLARSTKDLLGIIELLESKKVFLISAKENIDTSTPTGKLMITVIGAINEFERQNMLERQREGIVIAKTLGKYKGRKEVQVNEKQFAELLERYKTRQITKVVFSYPAHIKLEIINISILQVSATPSSTKHFYPPVYCMQTKSTGSILHKNAKQNRYQMYFLFFNWCFNWANSCT